MRNLVIGITLLSPLTVWSAEPRIISQGYARRLVRNTAAQHLNRNVMSVRLAPIHISTKLAWRPWAAEAGAQKAYGTVNMLKDKGPKGRSRVELAGLIGIQP